MDINESHDDKSPHFRVDYLVKMAVGLDLEHLTRLIKRNTLRGRRDISDGNCDEVSDYFGHILFHSLGSILLTDETMH